MTRLAENPNNAPEPARAEPVDFPIRRRIMEILAAKIVSGFYPSGEKLPIEADLIEELQVSRTALREAMRTLAAKGLIVSRKKAGTFVRPMQEWNLLDADVLKWTGNVDLGEDYLREICEARLIFEPKAARLAAARASADEVERIVTAFSTMGTAVTGDFSGWVEAEVAFHEAILRAANNLVLTQLSSVLSAALRCALRSSATTKLDFAAALKSHETVLDAIRNREPDRAEATMLSLVATTIENLAITELLPGSTNLR